MTDTARAGDGAAAAIAAAKGEKERTLAETAVTILRGGNTAFAAAAKLTLDGVRATRSLMEIGSVESASTHGNAGGHSKISVSPRWTSMRSGPIWRPANSRQPPGWNHPLL